MIEGSGCENSAHVGGESRPVQAKMQRGTGHQAGTAAATPGLSGEDLTCIVVREIQALAA